MSKLLTDLKTELAKLAHFRCEYCLSPAAFSTQSFELDHIIPESHGGLTVLENAANCCRGCNSHKYNKTTAIDEVTGLTVSLFNPRKQKWQEHFAWDTDPLHLIGLTPTGRATIDALQLNRPKLIELRANLQEIHRHPPVL